ncbi:MAG: translation initiation factor IF-2 [Bacteroidales bacterium]|nr:translation initiation factor IF-2 [Bacteroidales bacterium]
MKGIRLSKAATEFNVSSSKVIEFLKKKGHDIDSNPNTKLSPEAYEQLAKEFSSDIKAKQEAQQINLKGLRDKKEPLETDVVEQNESSEEEEEPITLVKDTSSGRLTPLVSVPKETPKVIGTIEDFVKPEKKKKQIEEKPVQTKEPAPQAHEVSVEEPSEKKKTSKSEPEPVVSKPTEPEKKEEIVAAPKEEQPFIPIKTEKLTGPTFTGEKIDLAALNQKTRPDKKSKQDLDKERKARLERDRKLRVQQHKESQAAAAKQAEQKRGHGQEANAGTKPEHIGLPNIKLTGPKVVGEIAVDASSDFKKGKRKRIHKDTKIEYAGAKKPDAQGKLKKKKPLHSEVNDEDVQKQVKETLLRLTTKNSKSKSSKYRRDKRDAFSQKMQEEEEQMQMQQNVLKVTEFASVNELASLMDVPVTQVIATCMAMGLFVSINQRLDAETMVLVADEFHYKVEFIGADEQNSLVIEKDSDDDLLPRPPIVTVMGHVDHGKTKLLDYIRNSNVIAGEAGGITQHIGAYTVELENERQITFLDTPGHEAFTAMRARGAKVTDVAIIVVAADDGVKQQTIEAINHASAAGVPIIFAINKIDKPDANPDKVKEELANMNYLVEEWGGKYQSQDISAKAGLNIDLLLEKVLLEAEMLELKANPNRKAIGSVLESSLDKGRGYVATVLIQNGTLRTGDAVLAGNYAGHVKAMYNERNQKIEEAGPATPVLLLGLDGAPQAGDNLNALEDFREAREIATKRSQLQREQGMRTRKHITLDEIGRRIAIGNFQELNVIVKGDVDGSIEALSDSLIKLSTPEIQVNVIHKAVGQISESDVSLAAASNAIIVGFQVRPSLGARKLAEQEQIDVRIYSIIYDAIEELKAAMEGMLSPEIKEEIIATLEVLEVFKITKVGTIAGCIVREGKITRTTKVRLIRDGIVIHSGEIGSLKRLKDDVKEVSAGYECGLDIANFNDIQTTDIIEGYQEIEVKKKL